MGFRLDLAESGFLYRLIFLSKHVSPHPRNSLLCSGGNLSTREERCGKGAIRCPTAACAVPCYTDTDSLTPSQITGPRRDTSEGPQTEMSVMLRISIQTEMAGPGASKAVRQEGADLCPLVLF